MIQELLQNLLYSLHAINPGDLQSALEPSIPTVPYTTGSELLNQHFCDRKSMGTTLLPCQVLRTYPNPAATGSLLPFAELRTIELGLSALLISDVTVTPKSVLA